MQQALSQQKLIFKSILIVSLCLVGFWGINYVVKHEKDEANLIALGLGGPGLMFTAWQTLMTLETARNERIDKMFGEIEETIAEMKKASEMQDLRHDAQILELLTKQSFVEQKLELHTGLFGHSETIKELFAIKDKINSVNANVAAIAQHGKVAHRLDGVQLKVEELSKIVDGLIELKQ